MTHQAIAKQIIQLKDKDLALRANLIKSKQLSKGYHPQMEALHNKNAEILDRIIDNIGYPNVAKVGEVANKAAWLIIQHAISKPAFMKKCCRLLQDSLDETNVTARQLAYLTDRIATFEGQPQLFGTQFDWNEDGELSPAPIDDLNEVNQRRKSIGLNSLEEQTALIRRRAKNENESPPADFAKRIQEIKAWKLKVGWTQGN